MYAKLTAEEMIRLAAEFLARDVHIPHELKQALGPALMADLLNPEITNGTAE